jgi:hypothetical protein
MLKNNIFTFRFFRFIQSGMYIDFFFKKLVENYVRNSLVYSAQFFGEKYMIEYLTKKIIDSVIFNSNKVFFLIDLVYSYYFIQILSILLYSISIINLII